MIRLIKLLISKIKALFISDAKADIASIEAPVIKLEVKADSVITDVKKDL